MRHARVKPTVSLTTVQIQAAPSLRAPVSSQTIVRRLAERHLVSRCPLRVLPMTPPPTIASVWSGVTHEEIGLEPGIRSLSAMNLGLPGDLFQQDNARPQTARISQDCLHHITTLPCSASSPDLSPIENFWDHLGWQIGQPTSMVELVVLLQQLKKEISQDIIRNLYASMSARIALCIRAKWTCKGCQLRRSDKIGDTAPLTSVVRPELPFEIVNFDVIGPVLPPSGREHKYVLCMMNHHTHWPESCTT
ncbi:transposable element Tcb2 transposase [Trichonephila clavipes]|nr:transposable element Tcb2 transposase [Trichonephila clavipes]